MTGDIPPVALGSRVSLITDAEFRYEGIFINEGILLENDTSHYVVLYEVRSFGTEDRLATHYGVPQDEVFHRIMYALRKIKSIEVLEAPHVPTARQEYRPSLAASALESISQRSMRPIKVPRSTVGSAPGARSGTMGAAPGARSGTGAQQYKFGQTSGLPAHDFQPKQEQRGQKRQLEPDLPTLADFADFSEFLPSIQSPKF